MRMKKMSNKNVFEITRGLMRAIVLVTIACLPFVTSVAQTPGGTTISNQASATYSDGTNSYATVSNTVTVTVSNVSGLAITPDAGSNPTLVAGQTAVLFNFTVTNTGNFTDKVHFLAGGASAHLGGTASATITRAVIDLDNRARSTVVTLTLPWRQWILQIFSRTDPSTSWLK